MVPEIKIQSKHRIEVINEVSIKEGSEKKATGIERKN